MSGLRKEDFVVYEDDEPVDLTHFSAERVPVSLGIALDTSGSMAGEKIREANKALDRFVYDLLDTQDELFIYRFSNYPTLLQGWTTDRQSITRALGRIVPSGGTALYDTVVEAIPRAASGQNQKKALVVISDGIDTSSRADIHEVKQHIRTSDVLIYAIGIDGEADSNYRRTSPPPRVPFPIPWPFAPPGRGRGRFPFGALSHSAGRGPWYRQKVAQPQRRRGERGGLARHDRRQWRPDRSHSRPARSGSRDRGHRRRIEQTGTTWAMR